MNVWLRTRWPQYQALAQYLLHVRNETLFESLEEVHLLYPNSITSNTNIFVLQACPTVLGPQRFLRSTTTLHWFCGGLQTQWLPAHTLWRGEQRVCVCNNSVI